MSAWIVSKAHIDALVTAAMSQECGGHHSGLAWYTRRQVNDPTTEWPESTRHEISYDDADRASEVGMMLWAENMASIHYRYPDTAENDADYPGPCDFSSMSVAGYAFKRTAPLSPEVILRAISCFDYQSCEHPGWRTSEAYAFCQALAWKMLDQLDGYNAAPWGLEEEHVRPRVTAH